MSSIVPFLIDNVTIRQDKHGRFCLNDFHRAAGGIAKDKPSEWLRNKQTIELIAEIEKEGITAIQSKQQVGTFAVKELVYSYAMWISAAFNLKVIRAYDSLIRNDKTRQQLRHETASSYKVMSAVVQMQRQQQGKETKPHHFSNEARLINWALSGEFKSIDRDALSIGDLDVLAKLEERNTVLIGANVDYDTRKVLLDKFAQELKQPALMAA